jgi:hypothetical protein
MQIDASLPRLPLHLRSFSVLFGVLGMGQHFCKVFVLNKLILIRCYNDDVKNLKRRGKIKKTLRITE